MLGHFIRISLLFLTVRALPENLKIFKDGYSSESELKADFPGATWTEYGSSTVPSEGTGDYENVMYWLQYLNPAQNNCSLWCDQPLAMKWRLNPTKGYPEIVAQCAVVDIASDPTSFYGVGLHCFNSKQRYITDQPGCVVDDYEKFCMDNQLSFAAKRSQDKCDLCPDFEVKFLCKEPYEPLYSDYPNGCPIRVNSNIKREVDEINADLKMRDAAIAKKAATEQIDDKQKGEEDKGTEKSEKSLDTMKTELRLLQLLRGLMDKQ